MNVQKCQVFQNTGSLWHRFVEGTFWPMIGSLSILKTPGFRIENFKFSWSMNTNLRGEVLQPSLKTHKPTINLPHIGGISPVTKE